MIVAKALFIVVLALIVIAVFVMVEYCMSPIGKEKDNDIA